MTLGSVCGGKVARWESQCWEHYVQFQVLCRLILSATRCYIRIPQITAVATGIVMNLNFLIIKELIFQFISTTLR